MALLSYSLIIFSIVDRITELEVNADNCQDTCIKEEMDAYLARVLAAHELQQQEELKK